MKKALLGLLLLPLLVACSNDKVSTDIGETNDSSNVAITEDSFDDSEHTEYFKVIVGDSETTIYNVENEIDNEVQVDKGHTFIYSPIPFSFNKEINTHVIGFNGGAFSYVMEMNKDNEFKVKVGDDEKVYIVSEVEDELPLETDGFLYYYGEQVVGGLTFQSKIRTDEGEEYLKIIHAKPKE